MDHPQHPRRPPPTHRLFLLSLGVLAVSCAGGGSRPFPIGPAPAPSPISSPLAGGGGSSSPILGCASMSPAYGAVVDTATPTVSLTLTDYPVGPGPYMRIGQSLAG
ncbi:hypothetical protein IIA16_00550, partial [bacterium]|nr:hypothetical protein [bacterium]